MASHTVSAAPQLCGGKNDRRMCHLRHRQNDKPREVAAKIYSMFVWLWLVVNDHKFSLTQTSQ